MQDDSHRPLDVVVLGRLCIDFNPVDYFKPWPDCETFKKYVGGSPANIAVGLSRLGKQVGFIGCVSRDQMGEFCIRFFQNEGIDTTCIKRVENGASMGLAFTEILDRDRSSLMMYRNQVADLQLSPEAVSESYIASANYLLISGTALAQSPSREAALKAVFLARKHGTKIVFDIDFRDYTWNSRQEVSVYYSLVARESDIILGSKEEYDLTDSLFYPGMDDEQTAGRWLLQQAGIVVIKHGKQGSTAYLKDGSSYRVRPFPVEALKSFGGGDGYGSAFLYGLLQGYAIPQCLELGSASASMLVSSHGCSADMPTIEALREFIAEKKQIYGEMVTKGEKKVEEDAI